MEQGERWTRGQYRRHMAAFYVRYYFRRVWPHRCGVCGHRRPPRQFTSAYPYQWHTCGRCFETKPFVRDGAPQFAKRIA